MNSDRAFGLRRFYYLLDAMKREELAKKLARQTGLSELAARNEVDELVQSVLNKLRQGLPVKLPGVGKLLGNKKPR
jgi:nucleoid DNA-binding protein